MSEEINNNWLKGTPLHSVKGPLLQRTGSTSHITPPDFPTSYKVTLVLKRWWFLGLRIKSVKSKIPGHTSLILGYSALQQDKDLDLTYVSFQILLNA